jgi:hypothetical protein
LVTTGALIRARALATVARPPPESLVRTAVVLLSHRFDPPILDEFARMRRALRAGDQAFVLSDAAVVPDIPGAGVHRFAFDAVAGRAARLVGAGILRNLHLAWLDFFAAHPTFDHYWFVEYDVSFAGPWADLLDPFRDQPHDLFCAHLHDASEEPDWHWWHEIHTPAGSPDRGALLRGFLPIARLTRRAMTVLKEAVAQGWSGFLEGLVPTVLQAHGLRIGDFGGDGRYVPDGFRHRFYTSASDPAGSLCQAGTHRYRPAIAYPRIATGRIYHPVKPEACLVDAGIDAEHAGAAIGNLLEQVRQYRQHRDVPVDALLQALAGIDAEDLHAAIERLAQQQAGDPRYARLQERYARVVGVHA